MAVADRDALVAHAARLGGGTLLAVDHLGEDPRGGGLAGSARAAEEERVREAVLADRAGEGADHVVLPEHLLRVLRTVTPVERLVLLFLCHVVRLPFVALRHRSRTAENKGDRAPTVDHERAERFDDRWLRPGVPTAPARARLPLLPSGPDGIRRLVSRRTRPSTLRAEGCLDHSGRGRGFGPGKAGSGYRAPLAPRLARSPAASIRAPSDSAGPAQIAGLRSGASSQGRTRS